MNFVYLIEYDRGPILARRKQVLSKIFMTRSNEPDTTKSSKLYDKAFFVTKSQ